MQHIIAISKRLLIVIALILTTLPFVISQSAAAQVLPTPNCNVVAESGVDSVGAGVWGTFDGRTTLTCPMTDAGLSGVFASSTFDIEISFGTIEQTNENWDNRFQGGLDQTNGTRWNITLGTPTDFVGDPVDLNGNFRRGWDCDGQRPNGNQPSECKWRLNSFSRPHECATGWSFADVQGADAVPQFLTDRIPPVEWNRVRRIIRKVALQNLPPGLGCEPPCTFTGSVSSPTGASVLFAEVELVRLGSVIAQGDTGSSGHYTIVAPCGGVADRDPNRQPRVRVRLRQSDGWWVVLYRGSPVEIESSPISGTGSLFVRDFNTKNHAQGYRTVGNSPLPLGRWWEWVEIYNNTAHAWALSEQLGSTPNEDLPLEIRADCTIANCQGEGSDFAFWEGDHQDGPYIAFGSATARYAGPGRPDNREYHEFGHAFFFDGLNTSASSADGHAGNLNFTTTSSLEEGFASWYAVMVNKHIVNRETPHIYDPEGLGANLERNTRVFDGAPIGGLWDREEVAIAGLLLDLEDGPDDYFRSPVLGITLSSEIREDQVEGGAAIEVAATLNNDSGDLNDVYVSGKFTRNGRVVYTTTTRVLLTDGSPPTAKTWRRGAEANFALIIPSTITYDDFGLWVTEGGPLGLEKDDDPIDLTARQVWETLRDYERAPGAIGVHHMVHVYDAFKGLLGGVDANNNGRPDVDEVFIAHGFFSRSDGDNSYESGTDIVGRTDRTPGEERLRVPDNRPAGRRLNVAAAPGSTKFLVVTTPTRSSGYLATASFVLAKDGFINLPRHISGTFGGWMHVYAVYANGETQLLDFASRADLDRRAASGRSKVASIDAPRIAAGYRLLEADGTIHVFGSATHLGDVSGALDPGERAIAMATTSTTNGYIILTNQGRVARDGDAPPLFSSSIKFKTGEAFATLSITPDDQGYWGFTNKGRVIDYGSARFFGDVSHLALRGDIIASVATPSGNGYYLLGSDGGVFAFGDAQFYGSIPQVLPGVQLTCPVVGIVPTPSGRGYWMVACDGGVFAFGDAGFVGSLPGLGVVPVQPINGMVAFGGGYLMVAADGGAFNFGAPFFGSLGNVTLNNPITAITPYFG